MKNEHDPSSRWEIKIKHVVYPVLKERGVIVEVKKVRRRCGSPQASRMLMGGDMNEPNCSAKKEINPGLLGGLLPRLKQERNLH